LLIGNTERDWLSGFSNQQPTINNQQTSHKCRHGDDHVVERFAHATTNFRIPVTGGDTEGTGDGIIVRRDLSQECGGAGTEFRVAVPESIDQGRDGRAANSLDRGCNHDTSSGLWVAQQPDQATSRGCRRVAKSAQSSRGIAANARVRIAECGDQGLNGGQSVHPEVPERATRPTTDSRGKVLKSTHQRSDPLGRGHREFRECNHGQFPHLRVRVALSFEEHVQGDSSLGVG
jgi:hypothetical protein